MAGGFYECLADHLHNDRGNDWEWRLHNHTASSGETIPSPGGVNTSYPHAATSIGSGPTYTASYDAGGNMTCRAPDNTTTCAGTPTGAQLGYDNEGRLSSWQNALSSPTTTDAYACDGAGNRVIDVGG